MRYVGCIGARQSSAGSVTYVVSQDCTSTLDCFAAYHRYVSQVRWRLRKDGRGEALPCSGALRRNGGRGLRNPGEASLAPTEFSGLIAKPGGRV
ncbi:MAG: hypothetical protein LBM98_04810 [Oscillospiraceae bacterium]|nr:hypothetical protein [Oscillospiraceae bacterium]